MAILVLVQYVLLVFSWKYLSEKVFCKEIKVWQICVGSVLSGRKECLECKRKCVVSDFIPSFLHGGGAKTHWLQKLGIIELVKEQIFTDFHIRNDWKLPFCGSSQLVKFPIDVSFWSNFESVEISQKYNFLPTDYDYRKYF